MEPTTPDNRIARALAGAGGFLVGIAAQILFVALINNLIGPAPVLWSGEMLLLIAILLTPPILTRMYWSVEVGSPEEAFVRGLQLGALFWFLRVLFSYVG